MSEARMTVRKNFSGHVLSDKMDKTRVVAIQSYKRHPRYQKVRPVTKKVHAHDEKNESKSGDLVRIMETRPLSRLKRWRIVEIIKKG